MIETNYKSPLLALSDEWEKLSPSEKALCVSYRRLLRLGVKVTQALMFEINSIHEKYPDFHMGCIPSELEISQASEGDRPA